MGDGEEATGEEQQTGYDQPSTDPYQSSADQPAGTTTQGDDGTTPTQGADTLSEALFDQLGQLFGNGQFPDAIAKVKPLVDQGDTSNPLWARAAYGLVMCFDNNNDFDNAASYLSWLMQSTGTHQNPEWQQQLQRYSTDHDHYTGPFLLA